MPYLDQETIRLFDDINELDVIEVHYLTETGDERTAIGAYCGLRRFGREWVLRILQKPAIRTTDIKQIRILTTAGR